MARGTAQPLLIAVKACDVNCPQHITPRTTLGGLNRCWLAVRRGFLPRAPPPRGRGAPRRTPGRIRRRRPRTPVRGTPRPDRLPPAPPPLALASRRRGDPLPGACSSWCGDGRDEAPVANVRSAPRAVVRRRPEGPQWAAAKHPVSAAMPMTGPDPWRKSELSVGDRVAGRRSRAGQLARSLHSGAPRYSLE